MTLGEIDNRIERLKWLGKGDSEIIKLIVNECKKGSITNKECNTKLSTYGVYYDSLANRVGKGSYYTRNRLRLVWDLSANAKFFLEYANGESIGYKTRGNRIVEEYDLSKFTNVNDLEEYIFVSVARMKNYDRQSYREPNESDIKLFNNLVG